MLCTFIVISYNEEDYILEALESIRYQIERYGRDRTYQLILADDCSQDRTRDLIGFWLERYHTLFFEITKIYQDSNVGTCRNLADAIRCIQGEYFYSIAGDDILASTDVMAVLEEHHDADILASLSPVLIDGHIQKKKRYYRDLLPAAIYTNEYVKWSVGLGCPIHCGAAWNRRINIDDVLLFMCKFKLLDDRSRYYAAYRHYKNEISYEFIEIPLLIHRKGIESASNIRGSFSYTLNQDLELFFKIVAKEASSTIYRFLSYLQSRSVTLRAGDLARVFRYLTPYYISEVMYRLLHIRRINAFFNRYIRYLNKEELHANGIRSCSLILQGEYIQFKAE